MDRRNFLKGIGTLVGGIALDKAIPFNRVWSFPKEIKIVQVPIQDYYVSHWLTSESAWFVENIKPTYILVHPKMLQKAKELLNL